MAHLSRPRHPSRAHTGTVSLPCLEWVFLTANLPPARRDPVVPPGHPPTAAPPAGAPDQAELDEDAQAQALVVTMAQALTEVLSGRRPPAQLGRWIAAPSLGRLGAVVRVGGWHHVDVQSVRASRLGTDNVWGRVTFDCDGRPLTGALHLRYLTGRWRCAHVDLMLPGSHLRADEE